MHFFLGTPLPFCVKHLAVTEQMLKTLERNIVIDHILSKVVQIKSHEPRVLTGILDECQKESDVHM